MGFAFDGDLPTGHGTVALQRPDMTPGEYAALAKRFLCYMMRHLDAVGGAEAATAARSRLIKTPSRVLEGLRGLRALVRDAGSDTGAVDAAVVASLVGVFEQPITGSVYESPLMHWLAIEGIDAKTLVFARPEHFTHRLSGVIYIMRITMTAHALPAGQDVDVAKFRAYSSGTCWMAPSASTPRWSTCVPMG